MRIGALFTLIFCCLSSTYGQSVTIYTIGDTTDAQVQPAGGACLMGGATENDSAMAWFLRRANGGDIVVLRASGSDGYQNYLYQELGVTVNSVETFVFTSRTHSFDPYVQRRLSEAEAVWIAGGDQWNYISYWRDTPVDSLLNMGLHTRNLVIGGTSAGMAILGEGYFSAENGTVYSNEALENPYNPYMALSSQPFLKTPWLESIITDTHYDNPDRKGRQVAFLARFLADSGKAMRGIACDEYTAVCIDSSGVAQVFGEFPTYDDNAYFLQINCPWDTVVPEVCVPGQRLTWQQDNSVIKVYHARGTANGQQTFDLNDWRIGNGGSWAHWFVANGTLNEMAGIAPDSCLIDSVITDTTGMDTMVNDTGITDTNVTRLNPIAGEPLTVSINGGWLSLSADTRLQVVEVQDFQGRRWPLDVAIPRKELRLRWPQVTAGIYVLRVHPTEGPPLSLKIRYMPNE